MLSLLPIGCMKVLFPKLLVTIFGLGQYPHYKLGGGGGVAVVVSKVLAISSPPTKFLLEFALKIENFQFFLFVFVTKWQPKKKFTNTYLTSPVFFIFFWLNIINSGGQNLIVATTRNKEKEKQQNHTKNALPTTNFVRCPLPPPPRTQETHTNPPARARARALPLTKLLFLLAEGYEEGESRETSVVMGRSSTSTSVSPWEDWLEQALQALQSSMLLRSLRPLAPSEVAAAAAGGGDCKSPRATGNDTPSFQTFQGLGTWDRAAVEVEVSHATFQCWNQESPSTGLFVALLSSSSRC
jgi:hypothetical protein